MELYFLQILKCVDVLKHEVHINNTKFGFKLKEDTGHHHRKISCLMLFGEIIPTYQENHAFILIQNVYKIQTFGCLRLEVRIYTASCGMEFIFIHTGIYDPYLTCCWHELYLMWGDITIVTTLDWVTSTLAQWYKGQWMEWHVIIICVIFPPVLIIIMKITTAVSFTLFWMLDFLWQANTVSPNSSPKYLICATSPIWSYPTLKAIHRNVELG